MRLLINNQVDWHPRRDQFNRKCVCINVCIDVKSVRIFCCSLDLSISIFSVNAPVELRMHETTVNVHERQFATIFTLFSGAFRKASVNWVHYCYTIAHEFIINSLSEYTNHSLSWLKCPILCINSQKNSEFFFKANQSRYGDLSLMLKNKREILFNQMWIRTEILYFSNFRRDKTCGNMCTSAMSIRDVICSLFNIKYH